MWNEVIKLALSNGLWAVLFCALLIYQLKDSKKRETKYVGVIEELMDRLKLVKAVKEDTAEIVELVRKEDGRVNHKKEDRADKLNKNEKAAVKL